MYGYEYLIILIILILISIIVIRINNIISAEKNMSRLNVKVKDTSLVNKDAIEKMGAKGIVEIDNELKIILGPNSGQIKKYIKDLK